DMGVFDSLFGFLSHRREARRDRRAQSSRLTARYVHPPYEWWLMVVPDAEKPDPATFAHPLLLANVGQSAATNVTVWLVSAAGERLGDEVVGGLLRTDEPEREVKLYEHNVLRKVGPQAVSVMARWEDELGSYERALLSVPPSES